MLFVIPVKQLNTIDRVVLIFYRFNNKGVLLFDQLKAMLS